MEIKEDYLTQAEHLGFRYDSLRGRVAPKPLIPKEYFARIGRKKLSFTLNDKTLIYGKVLLIQRFASIITMNVLI